MPAKRRNTANITIHQNRTVDYPDGERRATHLGDLIELEATGGPGAPKAFWTPDGNLIAALVNFHDMPLNYCWDHERMPPEWIFTQAHAIDAARPGAELKIISSLYAVAMAAYKEMFDETVPPGMKPTRFCASVNRSASLHQDADKAPIGWLFSHQRNSPGYILFPRYGLRLWLEHLDVLMFDLHAFHASWTRAADKSVKPGPDLWRTNVTLFRDTRRD